MAKNLILLIEDNLEIRENMAEILELAGYEVIAAGDGKDGIELAVKHHPALIICDIMMPVLDGYGVLHALQRREAVKHTPFIFLSARGERGEVRKGMDLGADDYITKPFSGTELLNAVESRLRKHEEVHTENAAGTRVNAYFTGAGIETVQAFLADKQVNSYRKKQIIYAPDNQPHRVYYVKKGLLKAYIINSDGKEFITKLYTQGDFFGYMEVLENASHHDTVEVMDDAELAVISRADFEQLIISNAVITQMFMRMLAANLLQRERQLLGMAYDSLRMRVAAALLYLCAKMNGGEHEKAINISRENLAGLVGTAKESVIRTLSDFKEEGLISIKSASIFILNIEGLKRI